MICERLMLSMIHLLTATFKLLRRVRFAQHRREGYTTGEGSGEPGSGYSDGPVSLICQHRFLLVGDPQHAVISVGTEITTVTGQCIASISLRKPRPWLGIGSYYGRRSLLRAHSPRGLSVHKLDVFQLESRWCGCTRVQAGVVADHRSFEKKGKYCPTRICA